MHVLHYVIEYRGRHRKGISIYSAAEVNLHGFYCGFIDQKCISGHLKRFYDTDPWGSILNALFHS
jgi:hypothetical protein